MDENGTTAGRHRRVLIYEYCSAGGKLFGKPPDPSLVREGEAMVRALAESADDGLSMARFRSTGKTDDSLRRELVEQAEEADAAIVIAPEMDDCLATLHEVLQVKLGARWIGCSAHDVRQASDKWRLSQRLATAGLPTPSTQLLREVACCRTPARRRGLAEFFHRESRYDGRVLIKRRIGCGGVGLRAFGSLDPLFAWLTARENGQRDEDESLIVQPLLPGLAASVAVLCGPGERRPLPACSQRVALSPHFAYHGGETPLPAHLDKRAKQLAVAAVEQIVPDARGWVGVDILLDPRVVPDSSHDDYIIEINPRVTTSVVGLAAAAESSLVRAMIEIARGRAADLSFAPRRIRFSAVGIEHNSSPWIF